MLGQGFEPDKIDFKLVYTEFTFAIASEIIRHVLDDFAPIADLQGNKKRILYCQMWGSLSLLVIMHVAKYDPSCGRGGQAVSALPPRRTRSIPGRDTGFSHVGNRAGRCRWLAGFRGVSHPPPPPAIHSGAAPYSPPSPSLSLNTSLLKAAHISSLNLKQNRLSCSPPTIVNRVYSPAGSLPDFRIWESCRTMPMVGGFSRGSSFPLPFVQALLHIHFNHPRFYNEQQNRTSLLKEAPWDMCVTERGNEEIQTIGFQPDRVISRGTNPPMPPRSPDLSVCDSFLWGALKGQQQTRTHLKNSMPTLPQLSMPSHSMSSPVPFTIFGVVCTPASRRVGRKAVQCWDTEIGRAQPARSIYLAFSVCSGAERAPVAVTRHPIQDNGTGRGTDAVVRKA
ncbi:hypothetical protein PR048_012142 [Dryococelus australis]|uniref:Uncharacterized protein n=1 Tax=Dryococelus australis TaxID=614101 RepID=A0ABQ9HPA4_9NEOP|nr:hypothetical protein PR048_012142 [Dryococelus australis]